MSRKHSIYFTTFLILFISAFSQSDNDIKYGNLILNQIYLTDFDSAQSLITTYRENEPFSVGVTFYQIVLKQAIHQDLESINPGDSEQIFTLSSKLIVLLNDDNTLPEAWKSYMKGIMYFIQSAEKKRIRENFDAIQFGYSAVDEIETAVKLDDRFKDALVGVGVFKYWKSVYTLWIPFFTDERDYAFELFDTSKSGIFFNQMALDYQLIFIYVDQEKYEQAENLALKWMDKEPKSRLFKWAAAYVYKKMEKYDKAYPIYSDLYTYYAKTESIINQLELLRKRAICLNFMEKNQDALTLLAEVKGLNINSKNQKIMDKISEINLLNDKILEGK